MATWTPVSAGYTLSQRGLALRFECGPSTIRRQMRMRNGGRVSGYVRGKHCTWREHWEPLRYQNGRLHGYRFVERGDSVEQVRLVAINQDKDVYYLKSILGQLREFKAGVGVRGPCLSSEVLADNVDWLDCFIDRCERPAD